MSDVLFSVRNHIATITLNRPPVNALSLSMMTAFVDALEEADRNDEVRAAIITGRGRCFSAGVDLKEQLSALESDQPGPASMGARMYDALLNGRKPTVAALNGPALGAGLGIVASCCILVASDNTRVGIPEVDVGMLDGARHALRLLGHSTVNRMLLTGHQLDASELYPRRGIEACLPIDELMPYVEGIASQIASKDATAVQMARKSLAEVEDMGVLDGYRLEMELATQLGKTENAHNAMRAFLKR